MWKYKYTYLHHVPAITAILKRRICMSTCMGACASKGEVRFVCGSSWGHGWLLSLSEIFEGEHASWIPLHTHCACPCASLHMACLNNGFVQCEFGKPQYGMKTALFPCHVWRQNIWNGVVRIQMHVQVFCAIEFSIGFCATLLHWRVRRVNFSGAWESWFVLSCLSTFLVYAQMVQSQQSVVIFFLW